MKHSCADCGKIYRQQSSLVRHRQAHHLGLRATCYCGRSFTQTAALLRHQRASHGPPTYTCHCARVFTSSDALRKHVHAHHWTPDQRARHQIGGWCTSCWRVQLGARATQCAECSGIVSTQRLFFKLLARELGEQWMPSSVDNVVLGGCDGVRRRRPDVGFLFQTPSGLRFVDLEVDEDGHPRRDPQDEMLKIQDTALALPGIDVVTIRVDVPSQGTNNARLAKRAAQSVRSAFLPQKPNKLQFIK